MDLPQYDHEKAADQFFILLDDLIVNQNYLVEDKKRALEENKVSISYKNQTKKSLNTSSANEAELKGYITIPSILREAADDADIESTNSTEVTINLVGKDLEKVLKAYEQCLELLKGFNIEIVESYDPYECSQGSDIENEGYGAFIEFKFVS